MFIRSIIAAAFMLVGNAASAQVKWDLPVAWPAGNFHTKNAVAFAEAVTQRTNGRVTITVHPGGSLGLKGPETLRAVRDGIVPIAEMFLAQQAGDLPFLSTETMPFLIRNPDELQTFYGIARPRMEQMLARFNQKMLYLVPWPSQMIFTREPATSVAALKGVKIRTTDRNNSEMMEALGMAPVTMPFSDLIPALAAGSVQGVQTSAPTAVDTKLWEFIKNALHTNHTWSSNMVTVNLDKWNAISAEDRSIIEAVAKELQPRFWDASKQADADGQKAIVAQGMRITTPDAALTAEMEKATRPIWDRFTARVAEAKPVIEQYLVAVGRK